MNKDPIVLYRERLYVEDAIMSEYTHGDPEYLKVSIQNMRRRPSQFRLEIDTFHLHESIKVEGGGE